MVIWTPFLKLVLELPRLTAPDEAYHGKAGKCWKWTDFASQATATPSIMRCGREKYARVKLGENMSFWWPSIIADVMLQKRLLRENERWCAGKNVYYSDTSIWGGWEDTYLIYLTSAKHSTFINRTVVLFTIYKRKNVIFVNKGTHLLSFMEDDREQKDHGHFKMGCWCGKEFFFIFMFFFFLYRWFIHYEKRWK